MVNFFLRRTVVPGYSEGSWGDLCFIYLYNNKTIFSEKFLFIFRKIINFYCISHKSIYRKKLCFQVASGNTRSYCCQIFLKNKSPSSKNKEQKKRVTISNHSLFQTNQTKLILTYQRTQ